MPQDKNTRARHSFLDECFRREFLTIDELLDRLNNHLESHGLRQISERSLRGDLQIFESDYGAEFNPNLREGKKRIYHYEDNSFSINKFNELSDSDKQLLGDAMKLLSQVDGLPFYDNLAKVRMDVRNIADSKLSDEPVIFYDTIAELKGLKKWWQICYDSILQKKVLNIDYEEFDDKKYLYTVSPYALKEYNKRWFLICTNHAMRDRYYNIPLDRIVNISVSNGDSYVPNHSDIVDYYDEVYGITNRADEPVEHIRFVAYGLTARYIETKPFYPYCKMRWLEDGSLEVRLDVKLNYELEHLLLSWSDAIKILAPKRLVDRHIALLQSAMDRYK